MEELSDLEAGAALRAAHADALQRLAQGASARRDPMHTPVVATADADARVMVLRDFDPPTMTLRFHTDARAAKVAVVEADPSVGVLFYDKEAGLQLRCRGRGRVERQGAPVDEAWENSTLFARRCYLGDPPGVVSTGPTSGLPLWVEGRQPTAEDLHTARPNFAILLIALDEIDWYRLAHTGHRRAVFRRADGWRGEWLTP